MKLTLASFTDYSLTQATTINEFELFTEAALAMNFRVGQLIGPTRTGLSLNSYDAYPTKAQEGSGAHDCQIQASCNGLCSHGRTDEAYKVKYL